MGETGVFVDRFQEDLARGRVIGSRTPEGISRGGIDRERTLSIDGGALRIQPLVKPGWGRAGIAYGPYPRRNGLAFAALLTNGHNISRTEPLPEGLRMRLWRWRLGTEAEEPRKRILGWLRSGQKRFMWRRLLHWVRTGTGLFACPRLDENLAVGWFPSQAPSDPTVEGNGLVVHAIVPEGGELWARNGLRAQPVLRGLQNLPTYYVVVMRETGAAYYAASIECGTALPSLPRMRLLGIDAFCREGPLYGGVFQSVLGEIGFRADSRVHQTQVAQLPDFAEWYGSAHVADPLVGESTLHGSLAQIGGTWEVFDGAMDRSSHGLISVRARSTAVIRAGEPSGFVHVLADTSGDRTASVGLVWRYRDPENFWCFEADRERCCLAVKEGGRWSALPSTVAQRLAPGATTSLQLSDDGKRMRLYLDGNLVYGSDLSDARLGEAAGVGVRLGGAPGGTALRAFEAHPREIAIPRELASVDLAATQMGTRIVVQDAFEGPAEDLATPREASLPVWRREIGRGAIHLTGKGSARVFATPENPCAGRTAYTVEWPRPGFADLQVTITPPHTGRRVVDKGRAGLIFWQDPDNYITLSAFVEDRPAMSIAAFFQRDGFEELFDAVWSNVGDRMHWGVPHEFRVIFGEGRFLASIDGQPVLARALRDVYPDWGRFEIRRVGIVANWEWGTDTGSTFQNFMARDRS